MRKITINAGPPMDRIVTEWLAHLVLAIPAGPDGGTVIFDGGTSNGTVVAQRRPGVWSVSFRPNPDGSRIRYYASPHVVAAVIIAGEHDETAAIDTTGHPVDVTEELLACTGHEPAQELAPHELAVWEFLTGLARRLEPGPYPASLVAALPSYHGLRDAVDPDQEHFKGPHVNGLGDALRAVSAYDAAHGRPTVAALVRRGGGREPAAGWWDAPGDGELTRDERMAAWHQAVRAAVAYWHYVGDQAAVS